MLNGVNDARLSARPPSTTLTSAMMSSCPSRRMASWPGAGGRTRYALIKAGAWLPGVELGHAPVSPAQTNALMVALERLWQSVSLARINSSAATTVLNPAALTGQVRAMVATRPGLGEEPGVRRAWQAAVTWLDRRAVDNQVYLDGETVLGQGDCNLANFLWDGTQIRIVDFEDSGPSDRTFELAILVE